jgi:hypothetical protein
VQAALFPGDGSQAGDSVRSAAPISTAYEYYTGTPDGDMSLAKPNYSFDKRQREIAKKKQQEEKDARKREAREAARPAPEKGPG